MVLFVMKKNWTSGISLKLCTHAYRILFYIEYKSRKIGSMLTVMDMQG